ncbi:hypothetical protein [Roseiterribacter gracilis]|uniref:Uncharacterized protein n=1 Tax=Roseiterribacter gracilis TaxID=2812848 RepID=A0A8S8XIY6_9PROT|nr:hypothetical protein TMPK1_33820 [Rhodospirillales bacterium TMPK1]
MKGFVPWAFCALFSISAAAQGQPSTYAQHLVDQTVAKHSDVLVLAMHVTPPKSRENVIIASNIGRIGKAADEDDLAVIRTGKAKLEVNQAGDRFEVELPLLDVRGDRIGALGVVFPYKSGDNKQARAKQAAEIRDELRRRISHVENLVEPYPYDPSVPTYPAAQRLVDDTMNKYRDVILLVMHVTPPGSANNIILASNIGRIGKKADEDDLRVIDKGETNLEVSTDGKRFEVELPLLDKAQTGIGALGVVFAYKKSDDKQALKRRAEKIRDDMAAQIASVAKIAERN